MKILRTLNSNCSFKVQLALIKADLLPRIVINLNQQSLSFAEAADIHTCPLERVLITFRIANHEILDYLEIEDGNEQLAVQNTVLKQVIVPSEKYIWHLCVNRHSIIDSYQSKHFLDLLTRLLEICPNYQPTMDLVLHMPVFITIPSCLTFFEKDISIFAFLNRMNDTQRECNSRRGEAQQMCKMMHRQLRMEGFEDVIEAKLQNDKNTHFWGDIVDSSIRWNNLQGMNQPKQE
ncbi:hypothetical protein BLNAU_20113 [Blattamonas nauphoetae]|uniref:Uncharacterized protein n=1 Tax=Blattamonas nauphoetae TaxID=2049346 RepID=A0ABQ9X1Y2_9EUKA|nr:hypothetical protein BLNAU_20113 [Blattamonas nauphoetae]